MTTATATVDTTTDSGGLSAAEEAFFSSGGESTIPADGEGAGGAAPAAGADGSAAAAATGEAAAPAAGAPKGADTVPLARFLDEKKSRKALETQVAELRGKFSIIERLNVPAAAAEQAPAGPPKAEDDIFGAVKHTDETVAQLQKRLDDAEAATKAQNEQTTFVNNYRADADKFQAATPDYRDAYGFVLNARAGELLAIGFDNPADPTLTPDEKQAAAKALHDALIADEYAIAEMAFKKGKSPAEILYGLAKQRGYVKKDAAAADAGNAADTGKGAETLDRIERGQAANKSLATTGGASGDAGMTAERLIAMPIDEFEAWTAKNPAAAKRIMGG